MTGKCAADENDSGFLERFRRAVSCMLITAAERRQTWDYETRSRTREC